MPVHHQTRRSGRPYTLVLKKTDALFEREQQARWRDQADLAWLGGTVVTRRADGVGCTFTAQPDRQVEMTL